MCWGVGFRGNAGWQQLNNSIHPSILPVSINTSIKTDHQSSPAQMIVGWWSPCQLCRVESEVTPWASCQCITGPHREANNHSHSHIRTVQSFREKRQLVLKPLSSVGETLLINVQRIQKSESLFYSYMTSEMLWLCMLFEDIYLFPKWRWETFRWSRQLLFPDWVWMSGYKGL